VNAHRAKRLCDTAIQTFGLDLTGQCVLTEAASSNYQLTPLIAALAGADVIALTRDSRYGSASEIIRDTMRMANAWDLASRIQIITDRTSPALQEATLITNCGFVRPIDTALLARISSRAVVSLMWETWEFRDADLDLAACRSMGIPVLGTDEQHADLRIFEYIGLVVIKLLLEVEIEVFKSDVLILGSGSFASCTKQALDQAQAQTTLHASYHAEAALHADAIVCVEHHRTEALITAAQMAELKKGNPGVRLIHLCGHLDHKALDESGLCCHPYPPAPSGFMTVATDYVGPRPLIELHTAGLRVGADLAAARAKGLDGLDAEREALKTCPYAQGFAGIHT
jgi:hypothetical protein